MHKTCSNLCPLCRQAKLVRKFTEAHPWLMCCPKCGLALADPQPTDAELAGIYCADYYNQFGYVKGRDAGLAKMKRATYGRMLRRAERFVRVGNLLDVGCGLGYSLEAARRRGWRAVGLEPHALAGQADSTEAVVRGDLETWRTEQRFELVSMIDVIEHVRDPVAAVRRAAELLSDGGVLLLATNNVASRSARRLGPRWVHFHRAHLWYFSPATLAAAVEQAGMAVIDLSVAWRVYNLDYVCGILGGGSNFPLAGRLARMANRLTPRPLRLMPWPPLPEGIVLLAQRA